MTVRRLLSITPWGAGRLHNRIHWLIPSSTHQTVDITAVLPTVVKADLVEERIEWQRIGWRVLATRKFLGPARLVPNPLPPGPGRAFTMKQPQALYPVGSRTNSAIGRGRLRMWATGAGGPTITQSQAGRREGFMYRLALECLCSCGRLELSTDSARDGCVIN